MNKIRLPSYDDAAAFSELSENERLASYPHLKPLVRTVQSSYTQYMAVSGVPTLIQGQPITAAEAQLLKGHYDSPPKSLRYINELRESNEHLVCPMCGSMHSGTLDHYLPKNSYPIFAVFSKNLVPACKCNSKRVETLLGAAPGERILHPYFDDCLGERLVSARFEDLCDVPIVTVILTIPNTHPHYSAIGFHFRSIVEKTAVVAYLRGLWSSMYRKPSLVVRAFAKNVATQAEVRALLEEERHLLDDLYKSKNNWNSIFISGLLDPTVLAWLAGRLSISGRVPDSPLG